MCSFFLPLMGGFGRRRAWRSLCLLQVERVSRLPEGDAAAGVAALTLARLCFMALEVMDTHSGSCQSAEAWLPPGCRYCCCSPHHAPHHLRQTEHDLQSPLHHRGLSRARHVLLGLLKHLGRRCCLVHWQRVGYRSGCCQLYAAAPEAPATGPGAGKVHVAGEEPLEGLLLLHYFCNLV